MWEVFNMGCGLVAVVPEDQADAAVAILAARGELRTICKDHSLARGDVHPAAGAP
ncbi:MAG: AIR synthase-related protein [Thermaurantiacus sp.]